MQIFCYYSFLGSLVGFPGIIYIQSHRLGFPSALKLWVSCTLLHSESQVGFPVCLVMGFMYSLHSESHVGFPVCLVMGFLYSSPFRVTGWVSCVHSDGFPLLFSIQSHKMGFMCAHMMGLKLNLYKGKLLLSSFQLWARFNSETQLNLTTSLTLALAHRLMLKQQLV